MNFRLIIPGLCEPNLRDCVTRLRLVHADPLVWRVHSVTVTQSCDTLVLTTSSSHHQQHYLPSSSYPEKDYVK
jgi:hypothetical protein